MTSIMQWRVGEHCSQTFIFKKHPNVDELTQLQILMSRVVLLYASLVNSHCVEIFHNICSKSCVIFVHAFKEIMLAIM